MGGRDAPNRYSSASISSVIVLGRLYVVTADVSDGAFPIIARLIPPRAAHSGLNCAGWSS